MAEAPRKRSRFDQTEPEPARKSRFDRRSRSPARNEAEGGQHRSRSPVVKSESPGGAAAAGGASSSSTSDAAAKAAAAVAARINEQLNAKKAVQQVDVPPVRTTSSPGASAGAAKSPTQSGASGTLPEEIYQQDGDYIKDIEVNDLRNRYTLTKGSTQKMIKEKTGADVTTRGNYYPDKSMATAAAPPLYLHVTSTSKDGLERAVAEINELMKVDLPNLIDERRFRRREPEPAVERDSLGRRKWPEERIPIDLEPIPGFNLRAQVVGQGGSYVKHIQQETRCRVQIKGRGSGFMEHDTQRESDEQMYLHVAGPDANDVAQAKELCLQLLETVREQYEQFKERGPPQRGGSSGGGNMRDGGPGNSYDDHRGGGHHHRERNGSGNYGGGQGGGGAQYPAYGQHGAPGSAYGAGGAQSPVAAAQQQPAQQAQQQQQTDPAVIAAWIQYYATNPQEDPYAAYGGYAAIMQYYAAQQQQQQGYGGAGSPTQQQQQQGMGMNGASAAPPQQPPPPGGEEVPPPPPPPPPPGA